MKISIILNARDMKSLVAGKFLRSVFIFGSEHKLFIENELPYYEYFIIHISKRYTQLCTFFMKSEIHSIRFTYKEDQKFFL